MRWKLIFAVPLICAIGAVALWLLAIVLILSYASNKTSFWIALFLLISLLSPFVWGSAGAWFAYRHTANRRKLHALVVLILTVCFTFVAYRVIDRLWYDQLSFFRVRPGDTL
jgi:branched-subunit amino acid ABC-type transport system permease component